MDEETNDTLLMIRDSLLEVTRSAGAEVVTDFIIKNLYRIVGQHENPVMARHKMNLMFDDAIYWLRCANEEEKEQREREADALLSAHEKRKAIRANDVLLGDLVGGEK